MQSDGYALVMVSDLAAKMKEQLVTEEDLRQVIDYLESSGVKMRDLKTGHFIGHRRLGEMTYWVEYTMEPASATVYNAYNHRMRIDGDEQS